MTYETENLLITTCDLPETACCAKRTGFLCRQKNIDQPEIIAHATVTIGHDVFGGNILEWIEVNTRERRKGIGREFRQGIENAIGPLISEGATDDGIAFRKALGLTSEVEQ